MEIYSKKIEIINESLEKLIKIKEDNPDFENYKKSWKDKDSTERNLHKIIEAIIDIGKIIITEKKLRIPANNREVFLILEENDFFPSKFHKVHKGVRVNLT